MEFLPVREGAAERLNCIPATVERLCGYKTFPFVESDFIKILDFALFS